MSTEAMFIDFCRANDATAKATKTLEKQQILGRYLVTMRTDDDLKRVVRYCGGRPFAVTDARVLNVGGAIVRDVIAGLYKVDPKHFSELARAAGESGEALAGLLNDEQNARQESQIVKEPLTLSDVARAFDAMAGTHTRDVKAGVLRQLLQRCTSPREAAYVVKIISGDLRTGVQEGVLQAAVARAFGVALSVVQRCQLLVGDLDEVAVLTRSGRCQDVTFRLFHPIQFMLATPQETPQQASYTLAGRTFHAETKWDGVRAQVHKSGEGETARVDLFTRTMDRIEAAFPDVVNALRQIPGEFLVDGEIVPYRDGKVLPFAHLQKRLGRVKVSGKTLREYPARFIAFDILFRNGQLLMDKPLRDRRTALEQWGSGEALLNHVTQVCDAASIEAAFHQSRTSGNEGLILKDPDSVYTAGRRGGAWLKLKTHLPTFDCVVTAAEYGHGKRRGLLSDYTFGVWDTEPGAPGAKLVNIGKAFSGVTDEEIAKLTELFLSICRTRVGRTHVVEPKVVMEIACDQIQKSARHASGYALRFPRIKRVRWDKLPVDADRLQTIDAIYQSDANFGKSMKTPESTPEPTLFDHLLRS